MIACLRRSFAKHRIHNIYHLPSGHLRFMGASQRSVIKSIYIYISAIKKKYYARETKIVTSRENDDDIRTMCVRCTKIT